MGNKKIYVLFIVIAFVLFMVWTMYRTKDVPVLEDLKNATNDSGSGGAFTPPIGGGGGGGGGGSGNGNNNGGTTPPDGGFQCTDCETAFLEGNPGVVTGVFREPSFLQRFIKPKGHWNCIGVCTYNGVDVSATYNCVPDPTQVKPENGWDDITGEKPTCWCLKRNPGNCAWYDANFGSGLDNLQCGGSCPPGETCASYKANGKEICNCTLPQNIVDCKFHFDDTVTTSLTQKTDRDLQAACYGWCENTKSNDCKYWKTDEGEPMCDCYGKPNTTKCGFHFEGRSIVSEQDYIDACYGWCETPDNMDDCVYWRNSTDYGNTWKPACTCRKEQEEFDCTDTDGGINYPVKGTCHDTQDWVDVCDTAQTTYLWEMRCDEIGVCGSVHHNCKDDGKICKDGACVDVSLPTSPIVTKTEIVTTTKLPFSKY